MEYGWTGRAAPAVALAVPAQRVAPGVLPRASVAIAVRRRRWLLALAVLLSVTVLQRFAIPVAGSVFGLGFLVCLVATLVCLMQGVLQVDPKRAALYGLAVCALLSTLLVKGGSFSLLSLAMLMTLYAPFVTVLAVKGDEYLELLDVFQCVISFVAWCGLTQFAVQFVLSPAWMFPFDRVLPEALFIPGYNLVIPFAEGYLKSTGLWFLEPSTFSQALAFGLLIELAYFRRLDRMILYGCAYLTSASGTGAMLLFALAPLVLLRSHAAGWLLLALLAFAALVLLRELPILSLFFERATEFDQRPIKRRHAHDRALLGGRRSAAGRSSGPAVRARPRPVGVGLWRARLFGARFRLAEATVRVRADRRRSLSRVLSLLPVRRLARPPSFARLPAPVRFPGRLPERVLRRLLAHGPGRLATAAGSTQPAGCASVGRRPAQSRAWQLQPFAGSAHERRQGPRARRAAPAGRLVDQRNGRRPY